MRTDTGADALRLRALLRDLLALSGISAAWTGQEPHAVAAALADALVALLQLDFAFVRLCDPGGAGAVDVARGCAWKQFPEWLESYLGASVQFPRKQIIPDVGGDSASCRGFAIPVGVNGGLVAAACERSDFPSEIDQLLLSHAGNQAATAFENARLIEERRRAEEELREARDQLEVKVAERTAELGRSEAHSAELAEEQAALRRVATLVAEGAQPADLFSVVTKEVAHLFLEVEPSLVPSIIRFDPGPEFVLVGAAAAMYGLPIGSRWGLKDLYVSTRVLRTRRSARVDEMDLVSLGGPDAELLRRQGFLYQVGSPIMVEGRLWGAMTMNSKRALPPDTGERLQSFTELVATSIANAESREALSQLAGEQAALRRVATMVAEGASPAAVFDAVAAEMKGLLHADHLVVCRYEFGAELTVLAHRGSSAQKVPRGTRISHEGDSVEGVVRRTERSARMESYEGARGVIPELARAAGVRVAVGAPIVVDGRLWGVVSAGWNQQQSPPADSEERIVQFAELLDTAIANAASHDQLTASRARLLAAGDEARRRVVRDLHDGAQQRLVHTVVTLKLAQRALRASDGKAASLIDEALEHAAHGNAELRELAHGILPVALTHGGLRGGISSIVARLDLPVQVSVPAERFPAEIEASAYFIMAEALTNVVKHARATSAEVTASVQGDTLQVEVRDDGIGGADRSGHGLVGMSDRVTALGGRLKLESPVGGGTHVVATLPVPAA